MELGPLQTFYYLSSRETIKKKKKKKSSNLILLYFFFAYLRLIIRSETNMNISFLLLLF